MTLFFSHQDPALGGYLVEWDAQAPSVAQCVPRLTSLYLHDWDQDRVRTRQPLHQEFSWRVVDHRGRCVVHHNRSQVGVSERNWLSALDSQLELGTLRAREPGSLLFLLAGPVALSLDDEFHALLAGAGYCLDYSLALEGPDGRLLQEGEQAGADQFRFLEKHEACLQV